MDRRGERSEGLGLGFCFISRDVCEYTRIKFSVLFYIQAESTMNLHHEKSKQSSFFTPIHVPVVFCVFDSFCSSYICNKEKNKNYPRLSNKVISQALNEFLRLSDDSV